MHMNAKLHQNSHVMIELTLRCVCVHYVCAIPEEARRGHWVPGAGVTYRWLWTI